MQAEAGKGLLGQRGVAREGLGKGGGRSRWCLGAAFPGEVTDTVGMEEEQHGTGPAWCLGIRVASTQRGARTQERRVITKVEGGQVLGLTGTPVCPRVPRGLLSGLS